MKITHSFVYRAALVLFVVGLSLSRILLSISQFLLIINWLWEGNFKNKLHSLKQNKSFLLLASLFLLHVLGLINTQNFGYAFHDLKIKIPLLLLPLVVFSSAPLKKGQLAKILYFFISSVLFSTFIAAFVYLGFTEKVIDSPHALSIFISHIRFSLFVVLAIILLLHFLLRNENSVKKNALFVFLIVWLVSYLFVLQSLTGIFVLFISLFVTGLFYVSKTKKTKHLYISLFFLIPILLLSVFAKNVYDFYQVERVDYSKLETHTAKGSLYSHYPQNTQLENGHYIYLYIARNELREAWNKRSHIPYDSLDKKQQPLEATLIRYLTSKSYRKDAQAVAQLSEQDIQQIENGCSNYLYTNSGSLNTRIYQVIWEVNAYANGANPSGNSLPQRFEFWKAAWYIFIENFCCGTGTGDVKDAFTDFYRKTNNQLHEKYRLRTHNQYFTFFVSFGFFGGIVAVSILFAPIFFSERRTYFFVIFFTIIMLSMLNEDTLETQAGASFFAFFYTLFQQKTK